MSKFGSLSDSDKPFRVVIKLGNKTIIDVKGNPFFIDVYSDDSAAARRHERIQRDQMIANARDGVEPPTQRELNLAKCAALTCGWHLVDPDTSEPIKVPCTAEAAKELYSLPNTLWLWAQVWQAASDPGNFIRHSAHNSLPGQSGISAIAAE
jgi:hypothetical protein